jgi:hypothetical protein
MKDGTYNHWMFRRTELRRKLDALVVLIRDSEECDVFHCHLQPGCASRHAFVRLFTHKDIKKLSIWTERLYSNLYTRRKILIKWAIQYMWRSVVPRDLKQLTENCFKKRTCGSDGGKQHIKNCGGRTYGAVTFRNKKGNGGKQISVYVIISQLLYLCSDNGE